MSSARSEIIRRLRANQEVDDWADLCIYPSGSLFVLEFTPPAGFVHFDGLRAEWIDQLQDEGELSEYFDTPEEAADLYLLLEQRCEGRLLPRSAVFREEVGSPRKARPAKKVTSLPAITTDCFEEELRNSSVPVVVLFWSPWSAPDRLTLPLLTNVANTIPHQARFFTCDIDECPEIFHGLKVQITPSVLIFLNAALHARLEPPLTEDAIRRSLAALRSED
ncbi:MAG: thioredoxin family protein [Gemmataceae bacterium]